MKRVNKTFSGKVTNVIGKPQKSLASDKAAEIGHKYTIGLGTNTLLVFWQKGDVVFDVDENVIVNIEIREVQSARKNKRSNVIGEKSDG